MLSKSMQAVLELPLGLDDDMIEDDSLLDEWILAQFSSTYRFCGSCRMATKVQGGVVDQSGLVLGDEGLRACDASIIPTVTAANTMWPAMMAAESIVRSIRDGRELRGHLERDLQ
jgi:choline dehydrogenase